MQREAKSDPKGIFGHKAVKSFANVSTCPASPHLFTSRCTVKFIVSARTRGAAYSNSRPQPGVKTFWGVEGGGVRWVGRSAAGVPRGGLVGTPTYTPQNDPHDSLMVLNIHKRGKKIFRKNLPITQGSHQPRSDPEVKSGVKFFFVFFKRF